MGNQLLSQRSAEKLDDPMAFIMKHHQDITFVKLLSKMYFDYILSGENQLFYTILGTLESEGPVVVKTYLKKVVKSGQAPENLAKYKQILGEMQENLRLFRNPNVMPYQWILLEGVRNKLSLKINRLQHFCLGNIFLLIYGKG